MIVMAAEYEVTIHGVVHRMLLDPEDAQRWYGSNAVEVKQAAPKNKGRQPQNKGDEPSKK